MKECRECGKLMKRERKNGELESARDFRRRNFCSKSCATKFRKAGKVLDSVRQAIKDSASVLSSTATDEVQRMTAVEFLEQTINDVTVDHVTRVNAAKALLPYQVKKPGETGKKQEQAAAANEVSRGKFSPLAGPKVVNIKQG